MKSETGFNRPAECPKCGAIFIPRAKTVHLSQQVEHTFYECPACHFKATVWLSDQRIRELMAQQKALKTKDTKLQRKIMGEVEALRLVWRV